MNENSSAKTSRGNKIKKITRFSRTHHSVSGAHERRTGSR